MAFDPDAYLGAAAPVIPSAAPVTAAAPESFNPDSYVSTSVDELVNDENFNPEVHAAQNPQDFDLAYQVHQAKQDRPFATKALAAVSHPIKTLSNAAAGVGNFLRGLAYQVPKDVAEQAYYSATDQPEKALTKQAEATLAAQQAGISVDTLIDATLGKVATMASKLDEVDPTRAAWRASFLRRNPDAREKYEKIWAEQDAKEKEARNADIDKRTFGRKVQAAKESIQLQQGKPLDTGAIASIYAAGGQVPSEEVGPEALAAAGAPPVDTAAVEAKAGAIDPSILALSVAPSMPGAQYIGGKIAQGAGKAMQAPMAALEMVPGKIGKVAAGTGAGVALGETAFHHPVLAAKIAAGVGAAKGLQKLGQVIEAQGKEVATGVPSELSERVAKGRLEKVRGTGGLDIKAEIGRQVGDLPASAATTAVGMAPLNLALSEGDPEKFVESTVGAGMFGAALGALSSSRPQLVEALRPTLRAEGVKTTDTSTLLGKKSAEYLNSLPEDARNRAYETMGALQGLSTEGREGDKGYSRFYVVDNDTYLGELKKLHGETASDGGRGFFIDGTGKAVINGDAQGSGDNLAHTMGHEGGHMAAAILRAAGAPGSHVWDGMVSKVSKELMPDGKPTDEFKEFIDTYNKSFDPTGKYKHLDPADPASIEEFLAEHAGRIVAGEGLAESALPKTIFDRIEDAVGSFSARAIGLGKSEIGQTSSLNRVESQQATKLMRDALEQISQKPRDTAPVTPEAATQRAEVPAVKPTEAPAPNAQEVNRAARLNTLGIKPAEVDSARDKAMQDAVAMEKTRRGKRPISEKSETEVAEAAGREFDQQFERYAGALEGEGVPHPEGLPLMEAIHLNELAPESNLPKWKNWAGRPQEGRAPRVVEEPKDGEDYPYTATPEETAALTAKGWTPEEIGAMPKSQVDTEVATAPAPAGAPLSTFGGDRTATAPAETPLAGVSGTTETPKPAGRPLEGFGQPQITPEVIASRLAKAEQTARDAEAAKTRRTPEGREKATNTAVKEARIQELATIATEEAADNGELLQVRTDENGKQRITGKLDVSLPSHRALADELGLSDQDVSTINDFTSGKTVYVDYLSAKNVLPTDITGKQRQKEYAQNPPEDRGDATGTLQKNKAILGVTLSVTKNGSPILRGISVDKYLANAKKLIDFAKKKGINVEYKDINDPRLIEDVNGYVQNHQNGWKGDGSGTVKGETVTPGYDPHIIPPSRFDLLNAAFHADVSSRVDSKRASEAAQEAQYKALENDWQVDDETGDTNAFRAYINKSGELREVNEKGEERKGTGEILEPVWESLAPDLIKAVKDTPEGQRDIVRDVGFTGDAGKVLEQGAPNFKNVEAGFMPGKGGEAPLSGFGDEETKSSIKSKIQNGLPLSQFETEAAKNDAVYQGEANGLHTFKNLTTGGNFSIKEGEVTPESIASESNRVLESFGDKEAVTEDNLDDWLKSQGFMMPGREQDELGFTSALRQFVDEKIPNKASTDQILATLNPAKSGIRQDELDWMGLKEWLNEATKPQGASDSVSGHSDSASDLSKANAITPEDFRLLDIPSKATVFKEVFRAAKNPEIRKAVIAAIPVDVMDVLREKKLSADSLFDNESVFQDLFSAPLDSDVSIPVEVSASILNSVASKSAKVARSLSDVTGTLRDELATNKTGNQGHYPSIRKPGMISKQELLDFIDSKKVELKEVVKGGDKQREGWFSDDSSWGSSGAEFSSREEAIKFAMKNFEETDEDGESHKMTREEAEKFADETETAAPREGGNTKFSQYKLPGGENYKEKLLTLPMGAKLPTGWTVKEGNGLFKVLDQRGILLKKGADKDIAIKDAIEYRRQHRDPDDRSEAPNIPSDFRSSHWDEPNVIAHTREQDFTDTEGGKVRVIEEIQSDWHQKGRKEGYNNAESRARSDALNKEAQELRAKGNEYPAARGGDLSELKAFRDKGGDMDSPEADAILSRIESSPAPHPEAEEYFRKAREKESDAVKALGGTPDAPFKKTWHELAFKRSLRQAVEDGMDKLAWVTGEIAADRFDLSKQVSVLSYSKEGDGYTLSAEKDGRSVIDEQSIPESKLEEYVGKEVAQKIIDGEGKEDPDEPGVKALSGLDLKVGGKGMAGFYDKIIPDFARKYVKKWGGKVETTELPVTAKDSGYDAGRLGYEVLDPEGNPYDAFETLDAARQAAEDAGEGYKVKSSGENTVLHSIIITPEMKASVLSGQPLFMPREKGDLSEFGKKDGRRESLSNRFPVDQNTSLPLNPVDVVMGAARDNDKILSSIVGGLPVDVVNQLSANNISPEDFARDPQMFSDRLPADAFRSISLGVRSAADSARASLRAGLDSAFKAGLDLEIFPAVRASDIDTDVAAGILFPQSSSQGSGVFSGRGSIGFRGTDATTESGGVSSGSGSREDGSAELARFIKWHSGLSQSRGDSSTQSVALESITPEMRESVKGGQPMFLPKSESSIESKISESEIRKTWFIRDGKRVYHRRGADGTFQPKNQALANYALAGTVPDSRDKKPLEAFQ